MYKGPLQIRWLHVTSIIVLLLTKTVYAATPRAFDIGVSAISYQIGRLSTNTTGEKNSKKGANFYQLGIQFHAPISERVLFSPLIYYMPEIVWSYPSPEGGSKTRLFLLGLPFVFNINNMFDVSAGLALMRYTVDGKGGVISLDNGSGKSDFAIPSRTETSSTWALQIGGAFNIQSFRFGLDLLTQGILSNQNKRAFSLMFSAAFSAFKI